MTLAGLTLGLLGTVLSCQSDPPPRAPVIAQVPIESASATPPEHPREAPTEPVEPQPHTVGDPELHTVAEPQLHTVVEPQPVGTHATADAGGRGVDPTALIAAARARAPKGSKLTYLRAHFVGANGLVDLTARSYKASIVYAFSLPPIPAKQKPGAPVGVVTPAQYFPDTIVRFEGADVTVTTDTIPLSMHAKADSEPRCSLAQVWAGARAAGAPANAVAEVSFPAGMSRERQWNFHIAGTGANGAPVFAANIDDATCRQTLDPTDAL